MNFLFESHTDIQAEGLKRSVALIFTTNVLALVPFIQATLLTSAGIVSHKFSSQIELK